MENKGFTLSLSGINFSIDEEAQSRLIQEVTEKVITQLGSRLEKEISKLLDDFRKGLLSSSPTVLPPKEEKAVDAPKKEKAPVAEKAPVTPEPVTVAPLPKKLGRNTVVGIEHLSKDIAKKLKAKLSSFKGGKIHKAFVKKMGFETLYDLLAYKYSHEGTQYAEENKLIDAIIEDSRLKLLSVKPIVRRYILSSLNRPQAEPEVVEQPEASAVIPQPEEVAAAIAAIGEVQKSKGGRRKKVDEAAPVAAPDTPTAVAPAAEVITEDKSRRGGKRRKTEEKKGGRKPRKYTFEDRFDNIELSQTLKGWLRKNGINNISEALSYCNDSRLNALIKDKSVNNHSMIAQLVKFLRENGYSSVAMRRFCIMLERASAAAKPKPEIEKKKVKPERKTVSSIVKKKISEQPIQLATEKERQTEKDKDFPVEIVDSTPEPDVSEVKVFENNWFNLQNADIKLLYSSVRTFKFGRKIYETLKNHQIDSMFELLYWIIDSSRINFSNKLFINKNELKRIESCLETHGFIEPVEKEKHEPLSYVYKSKYTEFIRFYRDKLITRRLPSDRYNKNLNEYTLDRLYGSVKDIDFNDIVLGNLEYYRISLLISLTSIILYRNETEYPNLFLPEVYKEIIRTLERNGLNNYKISAYIDGLKKYYYLQSIKVNKKLADKKR